MKTYEQMVSIYGTIAVNAKNKTEAKENIDKEIEYLKKGFDTELGEIIIGDIDRESDIYKRE